MTDAETLVQLFANRVAESGNCQALLHRDGDSFVSLTWAQVEHRALQVAAALVAAGITNGDRVALLSENRWEWVVCDLGIQFAGGVNTPVHASLTGSQAAFQIQGSGARFVFLSTAEQGGKLAQASGHLPPGVRYIAFEPCEDIAANAPVQTLAEFIAEAAISDDNKLQAVKQAALATVRPESLATILYTSGTTGQPKGVMLSQHNLYSNTQGLLELFEEGDADLRVNFLPLSHIYARTCDLYTWIARGSRMALATSRESVVADCQLLKPTIIVGVPYFFERLHRHLTESGQASTPGALKQLLGGELKMCFSGGAALSDALSDAYEAQGLPILQGYGLTETSPVISATPQHDARRGSSGVVLRGVDVRIAGNGEVLTRGVNLMQGYYNNPQATAEAIRDGWFHTGDLGYLSDDGHLYITGRQKEIIVTSGGKNVAPVLIESLLTGSRFIAQALVTGDNRRYLTALIVPNPDALRAAIMQQGIAVTSREQALVHPQVLDIYAAEISQCLHELSHYEQVRQFHLIGRGFTVESGEMTPKLSLRRSVIEANFASEIAAMYDAAGAEG